MDRPVDILRRSPVLLYAAEAVNSAAGTLLTVGLLFYMTRRFDWGARENFTVAACQGALYVLGALSAKRLSGRWKRIAALQALYAAMPAFAVAAGFFATVGWAVPTAAVVAVETGMMGASWPLLESLVSAAGDPDRLSKRLGWYNIVWATTGALALALSGSIIQHLPPWAFFGIVAAIHLSAGSAITLRRILRAGLVAQPAASARPPSDGGAAPSAGGSSERTLKLALWLSRIALPSTYVIIFSLAPALPTLHAVGQLPPALATVECSIWFVARAVAFVVLGSTSFWRRRPVLVLGASVTMLAGFLGTLAAGSSEGAGLGAALAGMALAQLLLGLSLGAIYACSLYFGMAVSKGSTEHGGYHEALIGFGQVLGPVVGVIAQWAHPGALWPVAAGISAVVVATIAVEAVAGARIAGGVAAMVGGGGGAAT